MLRSLSSLLAIALLLAARTSPAATTYADKVVERTLDNGFKVLLLEDHKAPVAVVQIWYRVGSRNEGPGTTGLSHLLEHMMFKGTSNHPPEEYSETIARNGGNENAFTADDATTYFATLAADRVNVEVDFEADRMRNLTLDDAQFQPERQVVMEERRLRTDNNPIASMFEALNGATFLAHTYRLPTIGWASDIAAETRDDLKAHYDRYYQPNNAFMVAVGDFDAKAFGDAVSERFAPIPRGSDPPEVRTKEPEQHGPRRVLVEKPAKLPFIALQYHVPNLHHPDSGPLEVLEAVLANGKSARLYRELVRKQRVALDADAGYDRTAHDDKLFALTAQAQPGVAIERLERALLEQIEAVQKSPPSADELARAKTQLEAAFVFAQDSMFYRGLLLGTYEVAGGWKQIDDYLPSISKVTAADVQRVAKQYLVENNRTTGILRPLPTQATNVEQMPMGPVR